MSSSNNPERGSGIRASGEHSGEGQESGSVGAGVGALGGGASGAAVGTVVAGPLGTVVGAVVGAIAGGLAGQAIGETIDTDAEDRYWRESYRTEPYAKDRSYEELRPAYRTGFSSYDKFGPGTKFEEAEPKLREDYEQVYRAENAETSEKVKTPVWEEARPAAKAAWNRVERGEAVRVPISEEQVKVGKREVEGGSVRLRKVVHTEVVNQPVELRREEVIVERVAPGTPGAIPADAFTEQTINVPLKHEEAVVEKTAKVVGEVRLNKSSETETETIHDTVRKEEVRVEEEGDPSVRRTSR